MEPKPILTDQIRYPIGSKRYSIRTEWAYVDRIKRFTLFHHQSHPNAIRAPEGQVFLIHLSVNQQVAESI